MLSRNILQSVLRIICWGMDCVVVVGKVAMVRVVVHIIRIARMTGKRRMGKRRLKKRISWLYMMGLQSV